MAFTNYAYTAQQMASLTETPPPPADVLDDVVNDKKRYEKELLEGIGSTLGGHSATKGIESLFKSNKTKAVLNKLGLSEEEQTALMSKLKDGDFSGAVSDVSKSVVRKTTSTVEDAVGNLKSSAGDVKLSDIKLSDVADDLPNASKFTALRISNPAFDPSLAPDRAVGDLPKGAGGVSAGAEGSGTVGVDPAGDVTPLGRSEQPLNLEQAKKFTQPQETEPVEQSTKSGIKSADDDAVEEGAKLGENLASKTAVKDVEETVSEKLAKVAVGSLAEDESPIGLAVTGILGVSSLVAGLFTKDHKKKFVAPPAQASHTNYAVQLGV